jgi:hypothetical protein
LHICSRQAGPKVATILSVVESGRRLRISILDYLAAILPGLADLPIQRKRLANALRTTLPKSKRLRPRSQNFPWRPRSNARRKNNKIGSRK